jgi:hypothetical protein
MNRRSTQMNADRICHDLASQQFTCCICCIGFGPCENRNSWPPLNLIFSTPQKCCAPRATVAFPTFPAGNTLKPQMNADELGSDSDICIQSSRQLAGVARVSQKDPSRVRFRMTLPETTNPLYPQNHQKSAVKSGKSADFLKPLTPCCHHPAQRQTLRENKHFKMWRRPTQRFQTASAAPDPSSTK